MRYRIYDNELVEYCNELEKSKTKKPKTVIDIPKLLQLQRQLNYLIITQQQPFKNQGEFKTEFEALVADHIFPLTERLNSDVFSKSTNAKKIRDFIIENSGIEPIDINNGETKYNPELHNIFLETNDRNYGHLIVTRIIEQGYQIKWSGKILKKTGVAVNYR